MQPLPPECRADTPASTSTMPDPSYAELKRKNEARLLAAERVGSGVVDAWPATMIFEFTAACNLHCFMCGFEMLRDDLRAKGRTKFSLPVETFRMVADKAFPHIRLVNPTVAGEPLMLPYFDEFLDKVAEYGCKLELVTNGTLLRGERLRKMLPLIDSMTVSFDGATKATFEYVRTGADFDQVMLNLENFSRLRKEMGLEKSVGFSFNVTLLKENVAELPQIIEIAARLGVETVMATYMIVMSEAVRASSPLNCPAETNLALAAARARAAELGIKVQLPQPLPPNPVIEVENLDEGRSAVSAIEAPADAAQRELEAGSESPPLAFQPTTDLATVAAPASPGPVETEVDPSWIVTGIPADWQGKYYCNMPWRRIYIGLGGEVFPCCAPTRPIVGNVFEQDFFDIWNGAEYRRLREGLYSGDLTDYCRRCPYLQQAGSLQYGADGHMLPQES